MFSKLKINSLTNQKFRSYLTYAVGEIILIVIGISIAVFINGLVEDQKQSRLLSTILVNIKNDMELDLKDLQSYYDIYESQENLYEFVLDSLDNGRSIEECRKCINLITSSSPFTIRTRGFRQLANYKEFKMNSSDSLIFRISNFYSSYERQVDMVNGLLLDNMNDNLNYLKINYPYFKDMFSSKFDKTKLSFFNDNSEFKNRVALGEILSFANHLQLLKSFDEEAKSLLSDIDYRLENTSD